MGVALADMRGAGWLNGYLLVRWELAHVVSFCAAKLAALFQSYFLDNRRSPVRRGADKPVGGFLASRLDIDLNSERFAACAGLRSACDNDQSRHSREVASRFEQTKLLDPRLLGSGGTSRKSSTSNKTRKDIMADPYLEKPKPSRSLPLFDLKRPRRAHTPPHLVPHSKSTDCLSRIIRNAPTRIFLLHNCNEFSSSGAANLIILEPTSPLLRLPRTAVGPVEQNADVGDDVGSAAISISSWTASYFIASRPRSTKSLGYEACAVGLDEVSEESVHLL